VSAPAAVSTAVVTPDVERLAQRCVDALRREGLLVVNQGPHGEYVRLPEGRVARVEDAVQAVAFSLSFDLRLPLAPLEHGDEHR
jgi:hypothetical protein